jgi:hypothetical protein
VFISIHLLRECHNSLWALYAIFNPFCHKAFMDMGFSRRGGLAQRRAQADQLGSLLAEIAARQAATPTAKAQLQQMAVESPSPTAPACAVFSANRYAHAAPHQGARAFHAGVALAMGTENQE